MRQNPDLPALSGISDSGSQGTDLLTQKLDPGNNVTNSWDGYILLKPQ